MAGEIRRSGEVCVYMEGGACVCVCVRARGRGVFCDSFLVVFSLSIGSTLRRTACAVRDAGREFAGSRDSPQPLDTRMGSWGRMSDGERWMAPGLRLRGAGCSHAGREFAGGRDSQQPLDNG